MHSCLIRLAFKEAAHTSPGAARVSLIFFFFFLVETAPFSKMAKHASSLYRCLSVQANNTGTRHAGSVLAGQAQPLPAARAKQRGRGRMQCKVTRVTPSQPRKPAQLQICKTDIPEQIGDAHQVLPVHNYLRSLCSSQLKFHKLLKDN